jgi:methyltransferase (TIGR00027 family)
MEDNKSSMTALVSAFGRAYHSLYDNPKIFNDYLARELITNDEFTEISGYMSGGIKFFNPEKANDFSEAQEALKWVIQTQIAPTPLARARYCEEMLNNAIMIGAKQYVILGAGMDTFAYRNPDLRDKIQVFEVDHPATQQFKKSRIKMAGWDIPNNLRFVSVDFTTDNIAEELKKAGFDYAKRTFFSWLGVTYYLTKENILEILKLISSISVKGSSIFFDYADEDLFCSEVKRVQNLVAMAQSSGEPMKSCYSYGELESVLEKADLLIYEHLTPKDIERRYFQNRNDYLHAFENIDYALAVVK